MLTIHLEQVWEKATQEAKTEVTTQAKKILGNLVHYPPKAGRYYTDDIQMLAAELLAWRGIW